LSAFWREKVGLSWEQPYNKADAFRRKDQRRRK